MVEVWKYITGYDNWYQVSNLGNVRYRDVNGNMIQKSININKKNGYSIVVLYDRNSKKKSTCYVHRLVAQAFIPNTNNLPQVNHKDGNKQNNSIDNLEWISVKNNIIHSIKILNNDHAKSLKHRVKCIETGVIYKSISEASILTNISRRGIGDAAVNKIRCKNGYSWQVQTAGGYHWKFID